MVDPVSAISGGITITQGILQFLGYVRGVADANVISAFFRWDGTRIEGNDKIEVERHSDSDGVWWFSVKELADYGFVRIPLIQSAVHELVGMIVGEKNPDARYWRWVAPERQGVIVGGEPPKNVKVDFLVVGYRPKALIKHFSTR